MSYSHFWSTSFVPPNDDSNYPSPESAPVYREFLKSISKQYREVAEAFLQDLNARGNIQCFGLTLNTYAHPLLADQLAGRMSPNVELQVFRPEEQGSASYFNENVKAILDHLAQIDLLECIFLSQEYHTEGELKGLPHYHVFLAVRSLFGTGGNYLQAAIQSCLTTHAAFPDCQLRRLHTFLDQKRFLNYVIKEGKIHYHALYSFSDISSQFDVHANYRFRFASITDQLGWSMAALDSYLELPTTAKSTDLILSEPATPGYVPRFLQAHPGLQSLHKRHRFLDPPPGESISVETLIYCLNLFCNTKSYFLCRGSLYRRRAGTRYAYELVTTLEDLLNDLTPVYEFLRIEYAFHFEYARNWVRQGFVRHIPEVISRVTKSSVGLLPPIQLNYHLIEFRNGIYNKRIGQFLHWDNYTEEQIKDLQFNCYLYFDRYFDTARRMVPQRWLELLRPQFPSQQELDEFCARFAVLFHGDSIKDKALEMDKGDRALYVEGVSNSGKTRLLADVVYAIVGPENVGLLGSSENFPLETATAKQVIVADEYRYKRGHRDLLLRLLDGTPLPLDQKHQAQQIISIVAPVLFLANMDRNQAMLTDEAFQSRLYRYQFTAVIDQESLSPVEAVAQELPLILVYCNRLFLNRYGSKFKELRKLQKARSGSKPLQLRLTKQGYLLPPPETPSDSPQDPLT